MNVLHACPQERDLPEARPAADLYQAQLRATMCFSMSACLSIWHRGGRPVLQEAEKVLRLHLQTYGALASDAQRAGLLLLKVRPKHHYLSHLLDQLELWGRNPVAKAIL